MGKNRSGLLDFMRSGFANLCARGLKYSTRTPGQALDRIVRVFSGSKKPPGYGEEVFSQMLGAWGMGLFPGSWTASRVEQAQHYRHWVWKSIRTIMELMTKEAPLIVSVHPEQEESFHRRQMKRWMDGNGSQPAPRRWGTWKDFGYGEKQARAKAMQIIKPHESFEFLSEDHPLQKTMHRPNEWDTGAELDQELVMYLELMGNSYEWPVPYKNAPGVAERWIMPAHWVWPMRTGRTHRLVDYYEVRPWGQSASAVPFVFDADEFIRYSYKSPLSKIDGQSPMQAGAEVVDAYEQTALARYFSIQNGANVGDVVQLDASTDPNEDAIQRFLAQWKSRYQGIAQFNAPGVLPPGAELIRRAGDVMLAYGKDSDQLRDYVLGLWGLTKSVVGFMEDANRASFEAALAQTFYLVINPRLSLLDTIRTERLASLYGKNLRIFHRDMTPADRAAELAEWQAHVSIAPYKGNEFRNWRGMEPLPEGEEVIDPPVPGADPLSGMSEEDLMSSIRGEQRGEANDNVNNAAGFRSQFGKRWTPSANGIHANN
jgi:portal protein